MLQLIEKAKLFLQKTAIITHGNSFTFNQLLDDSAKLAAVFLHEKQDLNQARVAFMVEPGYHYVATQWAIWQAGGVAVPLCISYPIDSLAYVIEDTQAQIIVASPEYETILKPYCKDKNLNLIILSPKLFAHNFEKRLPAIESSRRAMILYTSGTTSKPKGVVTTHANIEAQVTTLVHAWQWHDTDHILCVLPLHHVHGIINVISCALWAGATVEFIPKFSESAVFEAFNKGKINLFMAVPTIYFKLISFYENQKKESQKKISETLKKFRLMVSGSAALPVSVLENWQKISGHTLLERYGMTEIGMGISNPYMGERKAGHIGKPLPGVEVRLVDEANNLVTADQPGEIQIKGPSVFQEYWNKPDATAKAFTIDGWFKTGDIAVVENEYFRILGRDSIDIIKSGGYKISALEIEEVLRTHPAVADCAIVGLPNDEWGEIVAAAIITNNNALNINEITNWIREKLPAYKCPRTIKLLDQLPKNAMGKVVKNELKNQF